jgi:peptide/nickel transport system substrate-binding protein
MRNKGKGILAIGFLFFVGLSILSYQAWAKEKVITVGDASPLRILDPAFLGNAPDIMMSRGIYQSLLRYKFNSSEIEGDLAKSWSISKDGTVYTFKLRDDVYWHKGFGKFSAKDVKYSFERLLDPKTHAPARSELVLDIKEVKVIDDYTVEFHLKAPCAPFLHKLVGPRATGIVNQKAVEKFEKDYGRNPIGTGPFIFDSWTREQCVLLANGDFQQREGPPKVDKIIYKIVPDIDTGIMALQKGEIDLIGSKPREKQIMDRLIAAGCKVTYGKRPAFQNLYMNTRKKPFDDVRVRRAIAHAIDKEPLIKHVLSGMAEPLDSLIPRGFFGHDEKGIPHYEYNPEKAQNLLTQAGYPNGFEVNLDSFTVPGVLPVSTAIVEQLRKVNISAKLVVTDMATWWGKVSKGNCDFTNYITLLQPDADFPLMRFYHSSAFSPGFNMCKYDKVDDLIEKARREMNDKKRLEYYHQIQKKMMEDVPTVPLMMMIYPIAYQSNISGVADWDCVFGVDFYTLHVLDKK